MENIVLLTDSYKVSHYKQYPPGTETVYSYFESRGGDFDYSVFFGLQYYLKKYLSKGVSLLDIEEAEKYYKGHLGPGLFNSKGWKHIVEEHGGNLPVSIKAVPEGTVVGNRNVLMTIENTDPNCFWLTNYLETLLVQTWYGTTVVTNSREMKRLINNYLITTGNPELIGFKLHDFGFRGVSSVESAGVGGAAHLVNFQGTDTIAGLVIANKYYGSEMAGFSIPAAEHSTMTAWGPERETQAYANMLKQFPEGLVAVVSDSYDIYNACENIWGGELKDLVMGRNGTVVIRPDSGIPHKVVPEILDVLGSKFGFTVNNKGFKVLPDQVRVIQGDGIDLEETGKILKAVAEYKWSADNIAFGMGGGLLQKLNRDTLKFAFKCSSVTVNGKQVDVFKDPKTASWKASKRGRLKLVHNDGVFTTLTEHDEGEDQLVEVFRDGELLVDYDFEDIRKRASL